MRSFFYKGELSARTIKVVQWGHFKEERPCYFDQVALINSQYCSGHGYKFVWREDESREDRSPYWHKVQILSEELEKQDCDYLLWTDTDAFVYSRELKVEEELVPLLGDKELLLAHRRFRIDIVRRFQTSYNLRSRAVCTKWSHKNYVKNAGCDLTFTD